MKMKPPRPVDALVAASLLALSIISSHELTVVNNDDFRTMDGFGYVLMAFLVLPLLWRQRYPRAVLWAAFVPWVVTVGMSYPSLPATWALFIAIYGVGAYLPRPSAVRHAGAALLLTLGWTATGMLVSDVVGWPALVSGLLALVVPFMLGISDSRRRQRVTELELNAQRHEQNQRIAAADAVRAERARIARELHDVVAHEITVMTLQAEGASRIAGATQPKVTEALATIAQSGRKGLAEMQRMVGVLRATEVQDGTEGVARGAGRGASTGTSMMDDALTPMPSLAALPALARQVEDAGLPVTLEIVGGAHVPAGVELSAYRLVQEALTNALKYAGPGARATVTVRRTKDAVHVLVEDDGRGAIADVATTSGGHGLAGMRERVAALGGSVDVGARRGGGFRVRAVLPSHDDQVGAKAKRPAASAASGGGA